MNLAIQRSRSDRLFDISNLIFFTCLVLVVVYPLYFMLIASFSDPDAVNTGQTFLLPKDITFDGYQNIFKDPNILQGYGNSLLYTTVGTVVKVMLIISGAYVLSRKDVPGRNLVMFLIVFTMFFQGGLIPTYLLVRDLHLVNTMWALILPGAIPVFQLLIARTFFQTTIPDELLEASQVDGCSDIRFFAQIVLPLSLPIIAVIALFSAVQEWNSFFKALVYIQDEEKQPLQVVLRAILVQNQVSNEMLGDIEEQEARLRAAEQIKYGVVIVASAPMLMLYPFVQRFFVQGVMIGSVKG